MTPLMPNPLEVCAAGRSAFFGGRWRVPCDYDGDTWHHIAHAKGTIKLCPKHFEQVAAAGLVSEPNIGRNEYERREQERRRSRP